MNAEIARRARARCEKEIVANEKGAARWLLLSNLYH